MPRGVPPSIPPSEYSEIAHRYVTTNVTLQMLGDEYGLTRERIRQIIALVYPNAASRKRQLQAARDKQRRNQEELEKVRQAREDNQRCVICGDLMLTRRQWRTCSPECSEAYMTIRYLPEISGNRHAVHVATSIIRHSEKYKNTQIAWAKRVLTADGDVAPNRRYLVPGSKSAETVRAYLPDLYEKLTGLSADDGETEIL
jgi:hypothetical protein